MTQKPKSLLSVALSIFFALALSSCSSSSGGGDSGNTNATPKFSSSSSVDAIENSTDSFYTATATDSDSSDTLTFSISSGDDAAKFSINSSSGALSFSAAADYEAPNGSGDTSYKYLLQLKVSDNAGASDTLDLTVTLTNDTSDDAGGDESNAVPTEMASGYVVDGYIRNAFVCLDIDNNNECDDDEPYSKSSGDGSYSLDVSDLTDAQKGGAQLITIGGTDNDSGYRFTSQLQAPLYTDASGNIHITPITTLLAAQVTANTADAIDQPVADLQAQLALQVDPRSDPVTNNGLQKVAIQVQKSLELIAAALQVQQFGLPDEEAMDAAMQALADDLADAAEASRNGSSIRANSSIVAMATSNASAVDLPQLVGDIDKVTLADGTEITVPDNISSSAKAMAQEIDNEFDNATDTSDVNNIVYAVAVTVEELKDDIASTDSAGLANLDLETAIDIEDDYRVEIDRILSLIAYEPESNDDTAMFDYLVDKDSNSDITGTTTVAQFNDLLDGWLAGDSFAEGERGKLAELQQLALAVELQESADGSNGLELTDILGGDKGFYPIHQLYAKIKSDYGNDRTFPYDDYSTIEIEVTTFPYDSGREALINSTVTANCCVMRCSKCSHMSEYAALSALLFLALYSPQRITQNLRSTTSGSFANAEFGFNKSTEKFDLESEDNDDEENLYVWSEGSWSQTTGDSFDYVLSNDNTTLSVGYKIGE